MHTKTMVFIFLQHTFVYFVLCACVARGSVIPPTEKAFKPEMSRYLTLLRAFEPYI